MHALEKVPQTLRARHRKVYSSVRPSRLVYRYYNRECHVPTSLYFFSLYVADTRSRCDTPSGRNGLMER